MNTTSNSSKNTNPGKENEFQPLPAGFMTKAIHAGQDSDQWNTLSVIPPITMSSTFKQRDLGEPKQKFRYGRTGNPNRSILEECIATLESGKYGVAFSSGLGAATAVLSLLTAGDHFIISDDVFGGTNKLFSQVMSKFQLDSSYADTTNIKNIEATIKSNTKLIWLESATNPTLKISDIKAVSEVCKKHKIILAVDNTFITSYFHRPLEFGADIVVYSLTKFMNGHADIIMGAAVTNDEDLYTRLNFLQSTMGIVPSPFDCSQVLRSLKTLGLRMRQHHRNGITIAKYLEAHPKILKVLHPGLSSHPQHEVFKKQCSGHSGMIGFYVKGGFEESKTFLKALKVITLAGSLGGVESLISLPILMSHSSVSKEQLKKLQITDNFIRVSIGLEDAEDLIADLEQALKTI